MTTITPTVVRTKINIYFFVSVSPRKITASIEQHKGDKLFTTPIRASGIYFVQKKFIIEPIEPYTDLNISGLIFWRSIS